MPLPHKSEFLFNKGARDFMVEEIPLYNFSGSGEHLILKVRKREITTWEMLKIVSVQIGVPKREIGYAGLKDKHGLTIQYISIPKEYESSLKNFNHQEIKILDLTYHSNRLRVGHLKGNIFKVRLKKVLNLHRNIVESVLDWIDNNGMPNYFGKQRFGRDGNNYIEGKRIVDGELRVRDRRVREFLISSYQSHLFNLWLSRRVELSLLLEEFREDEVETILGFAGGTLKGLKTQKNFFKLLKGDIMMHYPYGKIFFLDELVRESERFYLKNIAPTGLLSGRKVKLSEKTSFDIEKEFMDSGVYEKGSRRYAWIFPRNIKRDYIPQKAHLEIEFFLPKGAYATVLIDFLRGRD
jgi:tRNA pseudouridine13 synthase